MANGDDSGYDSGDNSGEELFSEGEILDIVEQLQTKYGSNVTFKTYKCFEYIYSKTAIKQNKGKSVSKPPLPTLSN